LLTNASFIALIVLDPALFITIGLLAGSATLIDKEILHHRYALLGEGRKGDPNAEQRESCPQTLSVQRHH